MFNFKQVQKSLAISMLLMSITACNQQEFYEKEFLEGVGVPDDTINLPDVPTVADNPVPVDPNPVDPTPVDPTPVDPTPVDPTPVDPTPVDPTPVDPTPVDPTPVDPTPVDPTPVDPTPVDPTPVDPTPLDPTPVDPTPVDPTPAPGVCGAGTLTNASDRFVQNTAQEAKVDILWVMDNSGSMGDEQEALASNFNTFINNFLERDVDFQMAVTTTDPRSIRRLRDGSFANVNGDGQLASDPSRLTSAAAAANRDQFIADFQSAITVGVRGSGTETGLHTSKRFFERYSDWARDDAFLIVVYISDEEDQSNRINETTVEQYVAALQGIKAQAGMTKMYSIVTQEIDPSKQWETIGARYAQASRLTGGEVADIHQDFYTTLSNFGSRILDLLDSFPLSGVPVGTDISITMNGQPLAAGWTYDEASRTIRFDRNAIPAEGSIVIAYYQQCVGN
jgi:hypothetical protein